jgi:hypothetical protein
MRNKDLNRLYWLNKDIERRRERIEENFMIFSCVCDIMAV